MRASFIVAAASRAQVTSTYNLGMPTLPQDKCCRSKVRREWVNSKGSRGAQVNFPHFFQTNLYQMQDIPPDKGQRLSQQPLHDDNL
jgi:hypothetical protein